MLVPKAMQTKKDGNRKILKNPDDEEEKLAQHVRDVMDFRRDGQYQQSNALTRAMSNSRGVYVTVLYLSVKFLWIINVILQFFLLNAFLGPEYNFWGYGVLRDLAAGRQWETSGAFPRVTMCDVQVRQLGNLHNWSIQCVLMINMFNEKIYLFLWWWFLVVAVLNIINFLYWVVISVVPSFGQDFVGRYLQYKGVVLGSRKGLDSFINNSLGKDGVTLLRLVSDNCGDLATAEIVHFLWIKHGRNMGQTTTLHDPNGEKVRLVDSDTSHDKSGEFHEQE